jgi:hypothetical protein
MSEQVQNILKVVLQKYRHLFYHESGTVLKFQSRVKNATNTGDAIPIKRKSERISYALKPVVDDYRNDMLNKGIIEPSGISVYDL